MLPLKTSGSFVSWPDGRPLISIIITNHNYAAFVQDTVNSALGQDYPNIEVIVVDDGSKDDSPRILAEYGDRIKLILKSNGGQASAFNEGFRECKGHLVLSLDADDVLEPHAMSTVVKAWTPGLSEIHYPLQLINQDGSFRPGTNPTAALASGDLGIVMLEKGRYICSPSSGNVYARAALEQIMPIPTELCRHSDGYLETLSPFFGPVLALNETLARYRLHSSNFSVVKGLDRRKIELLVDHDRVQDQLIHEFSVAHNLSFRRGVGLLHWGHLKLLLALDRVINAPTLRQTCWKFLKSVWQSDGELSLRKKLALTGWAFGTQVPGSMGKNLVQLAFSRPKALAV